MSHARLGLVALVLSGCFEMQNPYCEADWAAAPAEDAPPRTQRRVVTQVLPVESSAVDILFVIDDSLSMADEQAQLGIWSNELFDVLAEDGELPDLHIGVVSSSFTVPGKTQCQTAGNGAFHVGTATLVKDRFLTDVVGPDGTRVRNYTGTLTEAFAKLARVGDGGCGFEQPFRAARTALSAPPLAGTTPFLRADALLLVVFVTDEDDCSATSDYIFGEEYGDSCSELGASTSYRCFEHGVKCFDGKGARVFGERRNCRPDEQSPYMTRVSDFASFLKGLKPNPAQVIVAGVYGKPNSVVAVRDERITAYSTPRLANVCGDGGKEGTGATPAIRMNALLAEFGGRASHSSICDSELSWAMRDMGLVTRAAATRSHCLHGELTDMNPIAAGIQPACRVVASRGPREREERVHIVPCEGAEPGARCYTLEASAECATESQLAVRVATDHETLTVSCDVGIDAADYLPALD